MEQQLYENVADSLLKLKGISDSKTAKRLDLVRLDRIIRWLISYSHECSECEKYLVDLWEHMNGLVAKEGELDNEAFLTHKKLINSITSHLRKKHKLVEEGTYMGIGMVLGFCLGVIYDALMRDGGSYGMIFGLCLGLATGSGIDANMRKRGRII